MPINQHGAFTPTPTPSHRLLPKGAASAAVRAYGAAAGEAVEARRRLHDLQSPTALGRARNEDVAEFKSTKKPTHAAVDRLEQDVEDAEQMAQGFAELALDAEREMIDAVRAAERPDPQVALTEAREAVDACEAALRRATEAQALAAWMKDPTRPFGTVQPQAVHQALAEVRRLFAPRTDDHGVHTQTGFAGYSGPPTPEFREQKPSPYAIGVPVVVVDEVGS